MTTVLAHLRRFFAYLKPTAAPIAATALAATMIAVPQQAEAWTTPSSNGFLNQESYPVAGLTVTITTDLTTTDLIRVFFSNDNLNDNFGSHSVSINGASMCSGLACNGFSFTPPSDGQYTIVMDGMASANTYRGYVQCDGACANPQTTYVRGDGGAGGGAGGGAPTPTTTSQQAGQVVAATGASSASASGTAIGNAIGSRGGSGGPQLSTQGVFVSTQGENSSMNIWANLSGTKFSGVLTGGGAELTFGADWELGAQTILGGALSYGKYNVTIGGTKYESEALAFGPYISTSIGEGFDLDAYVLYARPEYISGATTWKTNRVMGGVKAAMTYNLGSIQMNSYLGASGFTESLPATAPGGARQITQAMASIGSRFDFAPNAAVRPSLTVGADAIRFNDGATKTNSVSPRIGFGLDADMGLGTLSVNLDGGEVFKDARAVTLGIRYTASF